MNCVGHQSPGLWAHPRDRLWQYKDLENWTDPAKILVPELQKRGGVQDGIRAGNLAREVVWGRGEVAGDSSGSGVSGSGGITPAG